MELHGHCDVWATTADNTELVSNCILSDSMSIEAGIVKIEFLLSNTKIMSDSDMIYSAKDKVNPEI